jgi:hypothetical protein
MWEEESAITSTIAWEGRKSGWGHEETHQLPSHHVRSSSVLRRQLLGCVNSFT